MQGSSDPSGTKWQSVSTLARSVDIVALQEAGTRPATAEFVRDHPIQDQVGQDWTVNEYQWNLGTATRPQYYRLYWLNVGRLRVNLALVVAPELPVVQVRVVHPLTGAGERPALGVEIGRGPAGDANNMTFYTFHAVSNGGYNAESMIMQVECNTTTRWAVLGDFNRNPDSTTPSGQPWLRPGTGVVCPPNSNTHPATNPRNRLDFMVRNATAPQLTGNVQDPRASDHLAVTYSGI
ncbi:endonuclease/exonuclease/phosphatase family protein [Nocardiopsis mwathae]